MPGTLCGCECKTRQPMPSARVTRVKCARLRARSAVKGRGRRTLSPGRRARHPTRVLVRRALEDEELSPFVEPVD